ncbi:unnamed protein product [Phyllotreta striolata]|uniref:ENTH domain-containing protein n=1 Tax=Phyllotreta striolata TaxID=444603 RepID=A0A9N9XTI7_PHYSR|nr:unnamed protein product [Phyllotreta striolata]
MAGQTIHDRLLAARHSIAGQGLAKSICKATTEEMLGPKKKHLDYLIHFANEPNVSIPQMANLLIERSQSTSWVVVFKALITTHHIMCYGNERFTQYLASSNVSFQLSNFVDKTGVQSVVGARTGYDMSPFIRRYAKYLNEKALSYRSVAFDFCKVKRGKEEGTLRTMNTENLLKTLPVLQNQLDALLEFDCTANDLTNGVINMCFMLLFRDLIRLFACYNDGVINLLEKYFEMNKKQCREALDLYKKFLIRMDRVAEFLKVAENIGIDKGDIPDLTRAPNSLLDALEQHLAALEGNTPTAVATHKTVKSAVSNFGSAVDDTFKQAAVAEEEAVLNHYRATIGSPTGASTNPFLSDDSVPKPEPILDLFSNDTAVSEPVKPQQTFNALDDLLSLGGNPFADFGAPTTTGSNTFNSTTTTVGDNNMWGGVVSASNAFQQQQQQQPMVQAQTFGNGNDFSGLFNADEPSVFDPLGDNKSRMVPQQPVVAQPVKAAPTKILTGDLESSLTSLVENLTMDAGSRGSQWNSPKNQARPAVSATGSGWPNQGQPMPLAGYTKVGQPMQPMVAMQPMAGQYAVVQQPMMGSPKVNVTAQKQEVTFDPFDAL